MSGSIRADLPVRRLALSRPIVHVHYARKLRHSQRPPPACIFAPVLSPLELFRDTTDDRHSPLDPPFVDDTRNYSESRQPLGDLEASTKGFRPSMLPSLTTTVRLTPASLGERAPQSKTNPTGAAATTRFESGNLPRNTDRRAPAAIRYLIMPSTVRR